jgi:hypothetical protein
MINVPQTTGLPQWIPSLDTLNLNSATSSPTAKGAADRASQFRFKNPDMSVRVADATNPQTEEARQAVATLHPHFAPAGGTEREERRPLVFPVPPMVYGLPDPSVAAGGNMDDWFDRWIKPLMRP